MVITNEPHRRYPREVWCLRCRFVCGQFGNQITAVVSNRLFGCGERQTAGGRLARTALPSFRPQQHKRLYARERCYRTNGRHRNNLSSALAVEFSGSFAVFTVNSILKSRRLFPQARLRGMLPLPRFAGAASLAGFTFLAPPVISGFTPTSAGNGGKKCCDYRVQFHGC